VRCCELRWINSWNYSGNTNKQNFELFGAVADVNGVGVPLLYLLVSTTKQAAKGAKEAILTKWLGSLKCCGIHPEFVLTDKDQSEINAVKHVWPHSKHQLCFWHALRAVKQRLVKNKSTPAPYDPVKAKQVFDFIEEDFIPVGQYKGRYKVTGMLMNYYYG